MATGQLATVLRHLGQMANAHALHDLPDRQLLERFTARQEEAAFTVLVRRHGPLVLGVCRRVLHHLHDAEDAFQATFLVLARKAAAIRKGESLGSWLHGVAYRIAVKAMAQAARRRQRERQARVMHNTDHLGEAAWQNLATVLDEELQQLPANYRTPLILCYWEGKTHQEAARQLGWPVGTVAWRLSRARGLLRQRLARRGVTLSSGMLAGVLVQHATAGVSAALVTGTVKAALRFAAGKGAVSAAAVGLARELLQTFTVTRLKIGTGLLFLAAGLVAAGAGLLAYQTLAAKPPTEKRATGPQSAARPKASPRDEPLPSQHLDLQGDPLPPGALARLGTMRFRHGSPVHFVAFSPDGKQLASGGPDSQDNVIRLSDPATGKLIRRLRGLRDESVWCIAFSRDGHTLVSAGATWDHRGKRVAAVTFWDVATGKPRQRWQGIQNNENICCLALSPDGRTLATGAFEIWKKDAPQPVRLWDAATGKPLRRLQGHQGPIAALAFSPDGKLLVSASSSTWSDEKDRTIRLWDAATGKPVRVLTGHKGSVTSLAFVPGTRTLASGSWDGTVRFWDVDKGKELRDLAGHTGGVHCLAFSRDGQRLAAGSGFDGQTLRLWNVATGRSIRPLPGHRRRVEAVAFSPTGNLLASAGGDDHTLRLWNSITGKELRREDGHQGPVGSLAFLPDGRIVTFSPDERTVRLWDPASGRPLRQWTFHSGYLFCVAVAPEGKRLAVAHEDKTIRLYDLLTSKEILCCRGSPKWLRGLAFSPDGQTLASGGDDNMIRLWDLTTGKEKRHFALGDYFHTVAFSPDGKRLAAGGINAQVRVWDLATGRVVFQLDSPRSPLDTLAFSPDGRILAEGHCGWVDLWDLTTGKQLRKLNGRKPDEGLAISNRCSLAFSPDGRMLAAAGWDDRVRLWEVATGQERRRFVGHPGRINCVAFALDGLTLTTGSVDTTALVWDLTGRVETAGKSQGILKTEQLQALWSDLAAADSGRAYQAMMTLAAAHRQSLPFLKQRLPPVAVVARQRLARLINDLGSARYKVRKQAAQELTQLGEAAEAALRQELQGSLSVEIGRRIQQLVERLEGGRLRQGRALEVLEMVPNSQARRLLEALANGAPAAWLTGEAKASVKRWVARFEPHRRGRP